MEARRRMPIMVEYIEDLVPWVEVFESTEPRLEARKEVCEARIQVL